MNKQCVRCWVKIDRERDLRCDSCREKVNEEFRWEISRTYQYYFKHHLKQIRWDKEKMDKIKEGI